VVTSLAIQIKTHARGWRRRSHVCESSLREKHAESPESVGHTWRFLDQFRTIHLGDLTKNKEEFGGCAESQPFGTGSMLLLVCTT